jgi:hypothetical protein
LRVLFDCCSIVERADRLLINEEARRIERS